MRTGKGIQVKSWLHFPAKGAYQNYVKADSKIVHKQNCDCHWREAVKAHQSSQWRRPPWMAPSWLCTHQLCTWGANFRLDKILLKIINVFETPLQHFLIGSVFLLKREVNLPYFCITFYVKKGFVDNISSKGFLSHHILAVSADSSRTFGLW